MLFWPLNSKSCPAGVLDTSLTWVAGGITGSQAFAAWDRGFDVWLGSSRSNPPHAAAGEQEHSSTGQDAFCLAAMLGVWIYFRVQLATAAAV